MTRGRDEKKRESDFVEILAGSMELAKEYNDNDGINILFAAVMFDLSHSS